MDISVPAIYGKALKGIRDNLFIYMLLLLWLMIGGIILFLVLTFGGMVVMTTLLAGEPSAQTGTNALLITSIIIGFTSLIMTLLSAGSRAGILSIGLRLRQDEKPGPLDFFKGIFKYTWRLFTGGILVGMLSAIPVLAFLVIARYSLTDGFGEIFTSGWNYSRAFDLLRYYYSGVLVVGIFQTVIFFWIAPWDEMIVSYNVSVSESLLRSAAFVFSKRHFMRVLGIVLINMIVATLVIVLTNLPVFNAGLETGVWYSLISVFFASTSSPITPWVQLLFLPLYAFAQLFLLPVEQTEQVDIETMQNIPDSVLEIS